jgi:hypothetical protein
LLTRFCAISKYFAGKGLAVAFVPLYRNPVAAMANGIRKKKHPSHMTKKLPRNSDLAELFAIGAESAKMPLQKALRRASRKALFWEEEVVELIEQGRTDAHDPLQLRFMEYALASAVKAGVPKKTDP